MPTTARGVVAVAGLALAVAGVAVVGPPWRVHQERSVAVPPATASETTVLAAYLDALDSHDCATALALSTADHRPTAERWCDHVANLQQGDETAEMKLSGVRDQTAGIGTRIDVRQHWLRHDRSIPDGSQQRGYDLVHTLVGWRIDGEEPD